MSEIAKNISEINSTLPPHVTLVAVSKTKPLEAILEAYKGGQKVFGENRVHEIVDKYPGLPEGARLHMIGHLQTNKVKYIIDKVAMIEGVDSVKLLKVINKEARKANLIIDVLFQFHIAAEETKYGFSLEEVEQVHNDGEVVLLNNLRIRGLMGMATFTDDMDQIRTEFRKLAEYFKTIKRQYYSTNDYFDTISMGMSGDYKIAIEEGSNMIRVGSAIFGARISN